MDLELGQHLAHQPQVVVHQAFPIAPHVAAGPPEDEHGVLAGVEQLVAAPQDALHAGVSDDAQRGAPADVASVPPGGRGIVHADDALGPVDLVASAPSDEVTRAGHQGTRLTVHPERLMEGERETSWIDS